MQRRYKSLNPVASAPTQLHCFTVHHVTDVTVFGYQMYLSSTLLSGDYIFALACGALYDSAFTEEISTAQPHHQYLRTASIEC